MGKEKKNINLHPYLDQTHLSIVINRLLGKATKVKVKVESLSPAYQAPPSMGFSRQEYWSGLPFPSPGDLPNPGIELRSPEFQADTLTSEPPGKPKLRKINRSIYSLYTSKVIIK